MDSIPSRNKRLTLGGLVVMCSDVNCGWHSEPLNGVESMNAWFGKPCPRCHQGDVLTEEDVMAYTQMAAYIKQINEDFANSSTEEKSKAFAEGINAGRFLTDNKPH